MPIGEKPQEMSNTKPKQEFESITRVEVIDENGRSYVNWNDNNKVEVFIQDEGKTLKIHITKKRK